MCAKRQQWWVMDDQMPDVEQLNEVANWIREAERVVVFSGAGISTDSGIPDFRGPNGLWTQNPLAEKTSTLSYYLNDPEVRKVAWEGRVRTFGGTAKPNAGHYAVTALHRGNKLHAVVTQNVDGLHQAAGLDDDLVVEVHGTIKFARCWGCDDRRPMADFIERVKAGDPDPHCELCGGVVKSDAILFEQALVPEVIDRAMRVAEECDVLLAVGSTLAVTPAAYVVERARASQSRVAIINGGPTERDRYAHLCLRGSISPILTDLVRRAGLETS
ncbi:MAG: NAD-dependent deacetylase [Actinomycetota bacterium]